MLRPGERVIELFHQLGANVRRQRVSDEEFLRIKEYLTRKSGERALTMCSLHKRYPIDIAYSTLSSLLHLCSWQWVTRPTQILSTLNSK